MSYLDIPGVTRYIMMFNDISYGFIRHTVHLVYHIPIEFIFARHCFRDLLAKPALGVLVWGQGTW